MIDIDTLKKEKPTQIGSDGIIVEIVDGFIYLSHPTRKTDLLSVHGMLTVSHVVKTFHRWYGTALGNKILSTLCDCGEYFADFFLHKDVKTEDVKKEIQNNT